MYIYIYIYIYIGALIEGPLLTQVPGPFYTGPSRCCADMTDCSGVDSGSGSRSHCNLAFQRSARGLYAIQSGEGAEFVPNVFAVVKLRDMYKT